MTSKGIDKTEKKTEKYQFAEGERVLCFHGPLIYEAKCINTRVENKGPEYFIHYNGWNKSWDEWVAEDRLLKYNDENLLKKEELSKKNKTQKKPSKRRTSIGSVSEKDDDNSRSNSPKPPISRKSISIIPPSRASIVTVEKQPDFASNKKRKELPSIPAANYYENVIIPIHFPDDLRFLLIYDLELICKRKKITKLPARVTVDDITDKYVLHKTCLTEASLASKFKEVAYALRDYFNEVLPKKLLYTFEKPQYVKFTENKSNLVPSSVYGIIHFLRLFVKIGYLMAHLQIDDFGTNIIEETICDYIGYLNVNINKYISIDDYQSTNQDYHRKIKEISKN